VLFSFHKVLQISQPFTTRAQNKESEDSKENIITRQKSFARNESSDG
jgi:hypothetical protein